MKMLRDDDETARERRLWSMIGTRLKIARVAALLSQAALADELGISRARWSMYESGKRPIRMLYLHHFVQLTGVSFEYIHRGDEQQVPPRMRSNMRKARALESVGDGG